MDFVFLYLRDKGNGEREIKPGGEENHRRGSRPGNQASHHPFLAVWPNLIADGFLTFTTGSRRREDRLTN
jgi:hypothetical protein